MGAAVMLPFNRRVTLLLLVIILTSGALVVHFHFHSPAAPSQSEPFGTR